MTFVVAVLGPARGLLHVLWPARGLVHDAVRWIAWRRHEQRWRVVDVATAARAAAVVAIQLRRSRVLSEFHTGSTGA
eukprot:4432997-Prymnesium_polylepis.1